MNSQAIRIAEAVSLAGGTAFLVGGCVRDLLLGKEPKDLDIEVHGLSLDGLVSCLKGLNPDRLDIVGVSFGVIKLTMEGVEFDVSVPRKDNKTGVGHTGFSVNVDPFMGTTEAARRRDFTMNAIMLNILTGENIDPFGGIADIENKLLRVVDPTTFVEDPLRAVRALQFMARLGFEPDEELTRLVQEMDVSGLPAERLVEELKKLLLKGDWFTSKVRVIELMEWDREVKLMERAFGVAHFLKSMVVWKQSWVPGKTKEETFACLLARGLATCSKQEVIDFCDRLRIHTWNGVNIRALVLGCRGLEPIMTQQPIREWICRSAEQGTRWDLFFDCWGLSREKNLAQEMGCVNGPLPVLLQGRDLLVGSKKSGKWVGEALACIREAQLSGSITDREGAIKLLTEKGIL